MHPWVRAAVDHFGLTDDPTRAGYVLPGGGLLDLMTRGKAGCAKVEHDTIIAAVPESCGVRQFNAETGSLRLVAQHRGYRDRKYLWLGLIIQHPPTLRQIRVLRDLGAKHIGVSIEDVDGVVFGSHSVGCNSDDGAREVEAFLGRLPELVSAIVVARPSVAVVR